MRGAYFNKAGAAESVNIHTLGNRGALPDTTDLSAGAIYAAEGFSYGHVADGDFLVILPGNGVLLTPSTYWLVVQANMQFLSGRTRTSGPQSEPDREAAFQS